MLKNVEKEKALIYNDRYQSNGRGYFRMSRRKYQYLPKGEGMSRSGDNIGSYGTIAIENYYWAKVKLGKANALPEESFEQLFELEEEIGNHVAVSIVFASMCIEAFLNDYAAVCLGDSSYYHNFDSLSPESKLMLIGNFLLDDPVDKGSAMFCYLRRLSKNRNGYVHSKTSAVEISEEYTEEEMEELYQRIEQVTIHDEIELSGLNKLVQDAKNGLEALREIALYIDNHDETADAISRIFSIFVYPELDAKSPRSKVIKELNIHVARRTKNNQQ